MGCSETTTPFHTVHTSCEERQAQEQPPFCPNSQKPLNNISVCCLVRCHLRNVSPVLTSFYARQGEFIYIAPLKQFKVLYRKTEVYYSQVIKKNVKLPLKDLNKSRLNGNRFKKKCI